MAGLRKRTWKNKDGSVSSSWELSYMLDGKQYKKSFKKKPTPQEMAQAAEIVVYNPYFKDFVKNEYLEKNLKLHCKASTIETYENYYKITLPPLYHFKMKDIKRRDIENFILSLKDSKSPKTINNILVFLKGCLNYASELKIISENPAKKINPLPLKEEKAKFLTEKQIQLFKKKLKSKPLLVNVFFTTLLETGMRISECIALEWNDINFSAKTISINKQYYRQRITATKNYETRIIDASNSLISLLLKFREKTTGILLFSLNGNNYINVNNMRERYFNGIIEEMEDELNEDMSSITPHCLRHTHASTLLSNGIPLKYVSRRLGHKDQKTTLNVYDHVLPSDNEKAIEFLNKIS